MDEDARAVLDQAVADVYKDGDAVPLRRATELTVAVIHYLYDHSADRLAKLQTIKALMDPGVTVAYPQYVDVIREATQRAVSRGHPDGKWVARLADAVSNSPMYQQLSVKAPELDKWPAWGDRRAARGSFWRRGPDTRRPNQKGQRSAPPT